MILFIIIFFVMVIVIGAAAVLGFSFYLRRKTKRLRAENQTEFKEKPVYRPLFVSGDEEIRNFESEDEILRKDKKENAFRSDL